MAIPYGNLQKYQNPNPLQRTLINRFLKQITRLVIKLDVTSVLDAGCAEGFVSRHLATQYPDTKFWGVDLDADSLARGREISSTMTKCQSNVMRLPFSDSAFDLTLCNEVLEHLVKPELALQEIRRVTRGYTLVSVPHEPWFRALNALRGKHLRRWGNDPEHFQTWGMSEFSALVDSEFELVAMDTSFPWLIALGKKANH